MLLPKNLKESEDYEGGSWHADYTLQELGNWVHLLDKRAKHRFKKEEKIKNLTNARNYITIMEAMLNDTEESLGLNQK